jgi:exopolysaccharide biosynthesis polyprenyl glycosylphosphotransferase
MDRKRLVKRAFDLAVALPLLVVLSPLFLLIALLIRLDSPGPALYRQERIGENGRPFTMFKFRSMYQDADPRVHEAYVTDLIRRNVSPQHENGGRAVLKQQQDPRVTRVGRVIRKTSLDELPQLFNVLRGEMSLVGPRPALAYEVAVYKDWHRRRLAALPGITGLWQIVGRNQVSFDDMVRLDIEYIEHQSLLYDIAILLRTPWAVLTGRGAG